MLDALISYDNFKLFVVICVVIFSQPQPAYDLFNNAAVMSRFVMLRFGK